MKHPIKPLGHHVVVQSPLLSPRIINGIELPADPDAKTPAAEIVATGELVSKVSIGQSVVYKPYGQTEVSIDGTDYVIVAESDILAVMEDD